MRINRCINDTASRFKENDMKGIRHVAVAALLGLGFAGAAQAHVFVGVGIAPVMPVMPAVPVVPVAPVVALPVYPPPPAYYPPPPPVYAPPVVVGYWGHPRWGYRGYYGYGYWR
jgi:hypothetical protein